jgi:L-alanine-DL-glutamate epimerase-like enolase superfamily enzyme
LSGLDIALWDIQGKKLGVPVWRLLGGKVRDRIKVYGWIGGDRPADIYDAALRRQSQGFTAVKMNATGLHYPTARLNFECSRNVDCQMLWAALILLQF